MEPELLATINQNAWHLDVDNDKLCAHIIARQSRSDQAVARIIYGLGCTYV